MNKLQAVNTILRALGERPLTSLDVEYPTLNIALPELDEAALEILAEGWWFNSQYDVTLQTDVNGKLSVPNDVINFFPDCRDYSFDGSRIINQASGAAVTSTDVKGRLVTLREFDSIPQVARRAIAYHAAYQAYVNDHGVDNTAQDLGGRRDRYLMRLGGDHTRIRQVNSRRDNKRVQRWNRERFA